MGFKFIVLLAVLILAGHVQALAQISPTKPLSDKPLPSKPLYEPKTAFSRAESLWALEKGTSSVTGQGLLKAQGGFIQTAVGEKVTLVPKNAYTDEIVAITRQDGFFDTYSDVHRDPEYNQFRRIVIADKNGGFRFDNLPVGEWYIATRVIWFTRDQLGKVVLNGGLLWGQIKTTEGQALEDVKLNSTTEMARYGTN